MLKLLSLAFGMRIVKFKTAELSSTPRLTSYGVAYQLWMDYPFRFAVFAWAFEPMRN
jgi:hypothetical protein